ncbi:hypothetical protein EB118_02000 [bacterium]|nr:hypothetical protein [bacterium]NDC94190.1 hypothetical protein [bacterium]NDD83022.1 hypothetical protein [bacterium]NDG28860.1 hypothetical protein [bacterium]
MEQLKEFSKRAEEFIQPAMTNPYIMAILKITLTLYASSIAPNPPDFMKGLFKNTYFKMLALTLILYISQVDFQLSIILSIAFVVTMNVLSGRSALESYANYTAQYTPTATSKLIEPHIHIHPSCINVTNDQLIALFGGDTLKLQESVNQAYKQLLSSTKGTANEVLQKFARAMGLPYNVRWEEPTTAPLVATLLINAGVIVTEKCKPPSDGNGEWRQNFTDPEAVASAPV